MTRPELTATPTDATPRAVVEIVANLDDATGEALGDAAQTLLAEGALDVWTAAIQMKKQRPGVMLSILSREADAARLGLRIMELTGSFGVRHRPCSARYWNGNTSRSTRHSARCPSRSADGRGGSSRCRRSLKRVAKRLTGTRWSCPG